MGLRRFPTSAGELFYGPLPELKDLKKLKSLSVDAIWNLAAELKLIVPYEKLYVKEVIFGNITDFGIPEDASFVSQLDRVISLLKKGKKVFVHCYGGVGRTSTALAAIEVALNGTDAETALSIANKYARGPETDEQDDYVEKLDQLYNGRPIPEKKHTQWPEEPPEEPQEKPQEESWRQWAKSEQAKNKNKP